MAQRVNNPPVYAGDLGLIPVLGRSPGERRLPTSVFLPEKSHGQRSLVGYSLCGRKELDTAEQLTHTHTTHTLFLCFHIIF